MKTAILFGQTEIVLSGLMQLPLVLTMGIQAQTITRLTDAFASIFAILAHTDRPLKTHGQYKVIRQQTLTILQKKLMRTYHSLCLEK